jgi:hydrogenase maturation protease
MITKGTNSTAGSKTPADAMADSLSHDPPSHERRVVVIGYGNPGRLDDGLGPALAERLQAWSVPMLSVESTYQLSVEDAAEIAAFDLVVFADAGLNTEAPFEFRLLSPRTDSGEFTTHALAPESVLGLAHTLYGARTMGLSLGIRGYDFNDFGEWLSTDARANLDATETFLATLFAPGVDPCESLLAAAKAQGNDSEHTPPGTACTAFTVAAEFTDLPS